MSEPRLEFAAPPGLPFTPEGSTITVGTFDGVHRGHWAVLQQLRRHAAVGGRRSVLVSFEPHPLRVVQPEAAPRVLTTPVEKKEILAESGVGYAVFLPFTPTLAAYSPRRFVQEILLERLQLAELVVGYDHGLGRGRSGDVDTLRELGESLGFEVHVVEAVRADGRPISSTHIRRALEQGDVQAAAAGLGRPYSARAPVVRGEGRGRALGYATANLEIRDVDKLLPAAGIYAVRATLPQHAGAGAAVRGSVQPTVRGVTGLPGLLHLGPRPTFPGSPPSFELHILDFDGDLSGQDVHVDFCARLRDIQAFGSVDELVDAIRGDEAAARSLFAATDSGGERPVREGGAAAASPGEP